MGASFAHVPLLIALGAQFGMPTILGAQLAGGFVAILVGLFYNKLSKIFTPLVTGSPEPQSRKGGKSYMSVASPEISREA